MKKLYQLKEWLTVPEAARHLSTVFAEDVAESDVLRLALDGRLVLSVYFVNHAQGQRGKLVGIDDVTWGELPGMVTLNSENLPAEARGKPVQYIRSLPIDEDRDEFIDLSDKITSIDGVWDLPMIGAERSDIEHAYQQLTGGPEVTLHHLEGPFVRRGGTEFCRLCTSFDDNHYHAGSTAQLRKINDYIAEKGLVGEQVDELLAAHKAARKSYLEKKRTQPQENDYYPADSLPEDGVLVVRTSNLTDFLANLKECALSADNTSDKLHPRRETSLINIIGALVTEYSLIGDAKKPMSQTDVINKIASQYKELSGVSKPTIEAVLAKYNKNKASE